MATTTVHVQQVKKKRRFKVFRSNLPFLLMLLPGSIFLIINNYIPMGGAVMAFVDYRFNDNFVESILTSRWVGFSNFEFLFKTPDVLLATRNTILYNLVFIALGIIVPVTLAIAMNELWNKKLAKLYQTFLFLPYFLSWIIVAYIGYALLSFNTGAINNMILVKLGLSKVNWYMKPSAWPVIIILFNTWKYTGYGMVVYLASLSGISKDYYEAASLDGASKWQQIRYITLPMLKTMVVILTLLAVGRIFNADFGLFYNVPMNKSALFSTTNVIDTMVYRALAVSSNISMASAAGLFQSVVGCVTVVIANAVVNKVDKDSALF